MKLIIFSGNPNISVNIFQSSFFWTYHFFGLIIFGLIIFEVIIFLDLSFLDLSVFWTYHFCSYQFFGLIIFAAISFLDLSFFKPSHHLFSEDIILSGVATQKHWISFPKIDFDSIWILWTQAFTTQSEVNLFSISFQNLHSLKKKPHLLWIWISSTINSISFQFVHNKPFYYSDAWVPSDVCNYN